MVRKFTHFLKIKYHVYKVQLVSGGGARMPWSYGQVVSSVSHGGRVFLKYDNLTIFSNQFVS